MSSSYSGLKGTIKEQGIADTSGANANANRPNTDIPTPYAQEQAIIGMECCCAMFFALPLGVPLLQKMMLIFSANLKHYCSLLGSLTNIELSQWAFHLQALVRGKALILCDLEQGRLKMPTNNLPGFCLKRL